MGMQVSYGLDTAIPKRTLYAQLLKHLDEVFQDLARQKECRLCEGHLHPDHIHMLIATPSKYSVTQVTGNMKGKSAIHISQTYLGQRENYVGMSFWARGYLVSTVSTDEEVVRAYIRKQERKDGRIEQLSLFIGDHTTWWSVNLF